MVLEGCYPGDWFDVNCSRGNNLKQINVTLIGFAEMQLSKVRGKQSKSK